MVLIRLNQKSNKGQDKLLKHSTLEKIIKLPEKVFSEGVKTSIFIFESCVPQNNKEIFTCYIKGNGLEAVKTKEGKISKTDGKALRIDGLILFGSKYEMTQ